MDRAIDQNIPTPRTHAAARTRFEHLEDVIYQYTRNQRSYHENMSLLLNQLVAPATASESAPHAPHAAHAAPTTASHLPRPPPSSAGADPDFASPGEDHLLISYYIREPISLLRRADEPPHHPPPPPDDSHRNSILLQNIRQYTHGARPPTGDDDDDDDETICGISRDVFVAGDDVAEIRHCGHRFKPPLLFEWLRRSMTCPNCRHLLVELADDPQVIHMDVVEVDDDDHDHDIIPF